MTTKKTDYPEICKLYCEGMACPEIARRYGVTRTRIMQILERGGFSMDDRPRLPRVRNTAFVGIHLPKGVKLAIRDLVDRGDEASVSGFILNLIIAELKERKISYEEPLTNEMDPLPFEGQV